ncbi:MAG: hypothetical protein U5K84_10690 [Alkalibacterium sp.]|nr:hypothetical protein [Alkalibacterium sp.]
MAIDNLTFHDQAKMIEYKHAFYFFESPYYELLKQIIEGLKESGSDTLVMRPQRAGDVPVGHLESAQADRRRLDG